MTGFDEASLKSFIWDLAKHGQVALLFFFFYLFLFPLSIFNRIATDYVALIQLCSPTYLSCRSPLECGDHC